MDKITKKIITTTDIHKGDIVLCRTHCDSPAKGYGIVWNTDRKFGYIYIIDWQMLTYAIPIGEIYAIYRGFPIEEIFNLPPKGEWIIWENDDKEEKEKLKQRIEILESELMDILEKLGGQ